MACSQSSLIYNTLKQISLTPSSKSEHIDPHNAAAQTENYWQHVKLTAAQKVERTSDLMSEITAKVDASGLTF